MTGDPTVKVTNLGKGWGIRCFKPDGKIFDQTFVKTRIEIGPACRSMLRWYDKLGWCFELCLCLSTSCRY
jgi:hypothetical protein